ncbi:MAG: hypothetical protein ABIU05_16005 [Nitrospirales bacterium]
MESAEHETAVDSLICFRGKREKEKIPVGPRQLGVECDLGLMKSRYWLTLAGMQTIPSPASSYSRKGDHRPKGLVLARSPHFKPHTLEDAVNLVHLAPTLAAHLGVQLSGIDGKPVSDFFQIDDLQRESNA